MIGETCKSPQDRVDTELTESAVAHRTIHKWAPRIRAPLLAHYFKFQDVLPQHRHFCSAPHSLRGSPGLPQLTTH